MVIVPRYGSMIWRFLVPKTYVSFQITFVSQKNLVMGYVKTTIMDHTVIMILVTVACIHKMIPNVLGVLANVFEIKLTLISIGTYFIDIKYKSIP